jgi:hypothetical protein
MRAFRVRYTRASALPPSASFPVEEGPAGARAEKNHPEARHWQPGKSPLTRAGTRAGVRAGGLRHHLRPQGHRAVRECAMRTVRDGEHLVSRSIRITRTTIQ